MVPASSCKRGRVLRKSSGAGRIAADWKHALPSIWQWRGSPVPVAASSNLKTRSSAHHVFRHPAPSEPLSLLSLLPSAPWPWAKFISHFQGQVGTAVTILLTDRPGLWLLWLLPTQHGSVGWRCGVLLGIRKHSRLGGRPPNLDTCLKQIFLLLGRSVSESSCGGREGERSKDKGAQQRGGGQLEPKFLPRENFPA